MVAVIAEPEFMFVEPSTERGFECLLCIWCVWWFACIYFLLGFWIFFPLQMVVSVCWLLDEVHTSKLILICGSWSVGVITTCAWGLWGFDVSFCSGFGFLVVVLLICFVSDVFDDLLVFFVFGFLIWGLFFLYKWRFGFLGFCMNSPSSLNIFYYFLSLRRW